MSTTIKPFDNYEISPCTRTEEPGKPGHFYFEVCEPAEADVWTLYGHIPGEGAQAIGDFATREYAEEAFYRITGQPFGSHEQNAARVRMKQIVPRLLNAIEDLMIQADEDCPIERRSSHFSNALNEAMLLLEWVKDSEGRLV